MSWIPDWVVNAGKCISEVVDDGLDLLKDSSRIVAKDIRKGKQWMRENTWGIVHYPVNAVLTVGEGFYEAEHAVVKATDDYLFEDEKREIKQVEKQFQKDEKTRVNTEEKNVEQLQEEAEKYAEQELQRLSGLEPENTQTDDTQQLAESIKNTTLKTAGKCIPGTVPSVALLATELQHKDDYTK